MFIDTLIPSSNNLELLDFISSCGLDTPDKIIPLLDELVEENPNNQDLLQQIHLVANSIAKGSLDQLLVLGNLNEKPVKVSIRQFVEDDYYLNLKGSIWEELLRVSDEIISRGYVEALLTGAIGIGKTTLAQIINAYFLYEISLELFPQRKFGLMHSSSIIFAMLNRTESLARDVTFKEFYNLIASSKYFQEKFSFDPNVKAKLLFPNNVQVIYASADSKSLLGKNIISGIIDEMNFMDKVEKSKRARGEAFDQALSTYRSITRRRKSRFLQNGKLPGCLCLVSSTGHPDDFTECRIKEINQLSDHDRADLTYIWRRAQWEVVPSDRFTGEKFTLEIGNEREQSKILTNKEDRRPHLETLQIPVEYKIEFTDDMDGSLRDFAGVTTLSKNSFIRPKERIWHMSTLFEKEGYKPIFTTNQIYSDEPYPLKNKDWVLHNPNRPRAVHIDLGLSNDSCGIAIGYCNKLINIKNIDYSTEETKVDTLPQMVVDLLFTIIPKNSVDIEFSKIRSLLYYLRDTLLLPIKWVTFDGFQSVDSKQILRKKGFDVGYQSVDGKNSLLKYRALRNAIIQKTILCETHERCFVELEQLELNNKTQVIDHPATGSKDTADALCGVFNTLVTRRGSWVANDGQRISTRNKRRQSFKRQNRLQ